MSLLDIARLFLFVREAAPNRGQRVEAIQRWCGGAPGESWCCYFATMVLDLKYQGAAPIPRCGACQTVYDIAVKNGWIVTDDPQEEDVILRVTDGRAHHIYLATGQNTPATLGTISGNTSESGLSVNGDRVAEHDVPRSPELVVVRYPRGS